MIATDIDIDLADRDKLLSKIQHNTASIIKNDNFKKHPTGIYVTDIPYNPIYKSSNLNYELAEQRGYFKLDILNVNLYNYVKNEQHLIELMREPDWTMLKDKNIVEKLIHIGNHYNTLCKMPEPVNTIPRLSMFLAVIRPAKKHLIGKTWTEINKTIWDKEEDSYSFKKSHAVAYANLVVVNMNLIKDGTIT